MSPGEMNDRGVERVMIAMYCLAGNDLISAYRYGKDAEAQAIERWIRNDRYGFLSDGDGFIRAVKKKASGKGWLKCPEFAKSEKFQERRAEDY